MPIECRFFLWPILWMGEAYKDIPVSTTILDLSFILPAFTYHVGLWSDLVRLFIWLILNSGLEIEPDYILIPVCMSLHLSQNSFQLLSLPNPSGYEFNFMRLLISLILSKSLMMSDCACIQMSIITSLILISD